MLQQLTIIRSSHIKISPSKLCILFILICLINNASAANWPDCGFQCKAGDVAVKDLWLGDVTGNAIPFCSQGSRTTAYLWARFENNANANRYAVILLADIYVNGSLQKSFYDQGICVLDVIPSKAVSFVPLYSLSLNCGQNVSIRRLVLSWETANEKSCASASRKCSNRNTKCFSGPDVEIQPSTPQSCSILGQNISCEETIDTYYPQIEELPGLKYRLTWKIDGSEVQNISDDGSIKVDWKRYGSGIHNLQLTVDWIDEHGQVLTTSICERSILVARVPSADIELS
jgi:hypothetical protein